jgi:hypothetical protein
MDQIKITVVEECIFCGKCNKFYRIMNYVHTHTVVCCYRGRVGTDLSVL